MTYETQQMHNLLHAKEPMDMMDAAKRVAAFLLSEFDTWSRILSKTNEDISEAYGEPVTPGDPLAAGLILALLHLVMEPRNEDGLEKLAESLHIPEEAKPGVRRKVNNLMDALGLFDDMHLFNFREVK